MPTQTKILRKLIKQFKSQSNNKATDCIELNNSKYQITSLGNGASGVVYKLKDVNTNQELALKVFVSTDKKNSISPEKAQIEINKANILYGKDEVSNLIEFTKSKKSKYYAYTMPYFGSPVTTYLNGSMTLNSSLNGLNIKQRLAVMINFANSINNLHKKGYVITDLKLENVVVINKPNGSEIPKLNLIDADALIKFEELPTNIAMQLKDNGEPASVRCKVNISELSYSPGHMPPELGFDQVGYRTDVSNLAMIFLGILGFDIYQAITCIFISNKKRLELINKLDENFEKSNKTIINEIKMLLKDCFKKLDGGRPHLATVIIRLSSLFLNLDDVNLIAFAKSKITNQLENNTISQTILDELSKETTTLLIKNKLLNEPVIETQIEKTVKPTAHQKITSKLPITTDSSINVITSQTGQLPSTKPTEDDNVKQPLLPTQEPVKSDNIEQASLQKKLDLAIKNKDVKELQALFKSSNSDDYKNIIKNSNQLAIKCRLKLGDENWSSIFSQQSRQQMVYNFFNNKTSILPTFHRFYSAPLRHSQAILNANQDDSKSMTSAINNLASSCDPSWLMIIINFIRGRAPEVQGFYLANALLAGSDITGLALNIEAAETSYNNANHDLINGV